ncbi:MAG: extracellular solute-binding protein, partial [Clostridia bacterium]|nr:extracellular solute-binding protein [Clostridia bacterium]
NWWGKLVYELTNFVLSFVTDYSAVTSDAEAERSIELWMGTSGLTGAAQTAVTGASGRDQAQVIKTLIGDTFTPQSGVEVDIRLVDMTVLLAAVASGNGPDVAINQEQTNPVNYALRGALYPLSSFDDCPQVLERFSPSAAAPFWLEGAVYALPETQVFSMLFYRTDILEELQLTVPQTWDEVKRALTVLNRHHLEIGLPNLSDNNLDVFYMLLYQYGGSVYNDSLTATALGSEEAITAFSHWAELYTKYNVTQKMDALTRFRTGEVPLMIAPFTFFNTLSASAPEIKGAWAMAPLPGTVVEGEISHGAVSASTGAVIFRNAGDVPAAWAFLKWWTSADTQSAYGEEMEILMGEAARWPTANTEAFRRMAWKSDTLQSILRQKEEVVGLPEVPGSYMTNRYVATAIRLVINNGLIPREAILDYSRKIDEEIQRKRWEFGMV